MSKTETAYLSARVPIELRNEFKSLAAKRGEKVQDLLRMVLQNYVDREDIQPPSAGIVVRRLRQKQHELKGMGIHHLTLFGSVARGDALPSSDVDLVAEFAGDKTPGLIKTGKIAARIGEILGDKHEIDLVPGNKMRASVSDTAQADAIRIF